MKNKEIIEGNKLIAEFMELKIKHGGIGNLYTCPETGLPTTEKELDYHLSWDWLIPVMQKIGTLGFRVTLGFDEKAYLNSISIKDNSTDTYIDEDYEDRDYEIESDTHLAWFNVVNFIKWYNENKV